MAGIYGDGSDGDVTISSNTTLTENKEYDNLTINVGITLNVGGYTIKVADTLLNNGIIVGVTIGTRGTAGATEVGTSTTGGNSNVGSSGTNAGDGGYSGAAGGGVVANIAGGGGTAYVNGGNGGAGGIGGYSCGDITILAYNLNNVGTINSSGSDGADATNGTAGRYQDLVDGKACYSGGGGGGQGGQGGDAGDLSITYYSLIEKGTLLRNGGEGGSAGAGGLGGSVTIGWYYNNTGSAGGTGTYGGDGGESTNGGQYGATRIVAQPGDPGIKGEDGLSGEFIFVTSKISTFTHGIKIGDGTNNLILSPDMITIISSGTASMPNALNVSDNTYGLDIDLPGTAGIDVSKIGVIILPSGNITWEADGIYFSDVADPNKRYFPTMYLTDSNYTYYTKDDDTGVMTVHTPGARTSGVISTWDGIISIFPIFGWDRIGDSLTSIRLWAATCYIILDGMSVTKTVYSIGNTGGITSVNYAVFLKEWNF